jgi:predicted acetyltransferase
MLGMALDEARWLGLKRVLITCGRRNVASARVIYKNGGQVRLSSAGPRIHSAILG